MKGIQITGVCPHGEGVIKKPKLGNVGVVRHYVILQGVARHKARNNIILRQAPDQQSLLIILLPVLGCQQNAVLLADDENGIVLQVSTFVHTGFAFSASVGMAEKADGFIPRISVLNGRFRLFLDGIFRRGFFRLFFILWIILWFIICSLTGRLFGIARVLLIHPFVIIIDGIRGI